MLRSSLFFFAGLATVAATGAVFMTGTNLSGGNLDADLRKPPSRPAAADAPIETSSDVRALLEEQVAALALRRADLEKRLHQLDRQRALEKVRDQYERRIDDLTTKHAAAMANLTKEQELLRERIQALQETNVYLRGRLANATTLADRFSREQEAMAKRGDNEFHTDPSAYRRFTSACGRFSRLAKVIKVHGNSVKLRLAEGTITKVDLRRLMPEDRDYVLAVARGDHDE